MATLEKIEEFFDGGRGQPQEMPVPAPAIMRQISQTVSRQISRQMSQQSERWLSRQLSQQSNVSFYDGWSDHENNMGTEVIPDHTDFRAVSISRYSKGKKVTITTMGSRGDVQPLIALGLKLKASGFNVQILSNENHVNFIKKFGLEVHAILYNFEDFFGRKDVAEAVATGDMNKFMPLYFQQNADDLPSMLEKMLKATLEFQPDLLVVSATDLTGGLLLSRLFRIPMAIVGLQNIWFPSRYQESSLGEPCCHYAAFFLLQYFIFRLFKNPMIRPTAMESLRAYGSSDFWETYEATFESSMYASLYPLGPVMFGISPELYVRPHDWPADIEMHITGFWVIGAAEQQRRLNRQDSSFGGSTLQELETFLAEGAKPVYMGWGSIIAGTPVQMTLLALRSLKEAGLRGIILGGWAQLRLELVKGQPDEAELEIFARENVLFVQTAAHEWLFPQCAVTVHHGGAGTTVAALRSGVPTIITPCFADQFDYANMIEKHGVGVRMPQFLKVTYKDLAAAMKRCIQDGEMNMRAMTMSVQLHKEDGLSKAVSVIDSFLTHEVATGRWSRKFEKLEASFRRCSSKSPLHDAAGCFAFAAKILCCSFYPLRLP